MRPSARPFQRLNALGRIGLGTFLVCGVGGYAAMRFGGVADRRELASQIARGKRLGLPARYEEIWPAPVPEAENAAIQYRRLTPWIGDLDEANRRVSEAWSARSPQRMAAALAPVRKHLDVFLAATQRPRCRFEHRPGVLLDNPDDVQVANEVTRLVGMKAVMEAESGAPLRALGTLAPLARAARHYGSVPEICYYSASHGFLDTLLVTTARILGIAGRDPEVRAEARRLMLSLPPLPSARRAMAGQWLRNKEVVDRLDAGILPIQDLSPDAFSSPRVELRLAMTVGSLRAAQELRLIRHHIDVYEAMAEDLDHPLAAKKSVDALIRTRDEGWQTTLEVVYGNFAFPVENMLTLALERAVLALLDVLDAPQPPARLPSEGVRFLDPFTEKPLRYEAKKGRVRVWSVGDDGIDQGGVPDKYGSSRDLIVAYPAFPNTP